MKNIKEEVEEEYFFYYYTLIIIYIKNFISHDFKTLND